MELAKLLDKTVKDTVTGFTGKVTGYAVYTTGSSTVLVEGIDSTNRPIEWWFNVERVTEVGE